MRIRLREKALIENMILSLKYIDIGSFSGVFLSMCSREHLQTFSDPTKKCLKCFLASHQNITHFYVLFNQGVVPLIPPLFMITFCEKCVIRMILKCFMRSPFFLLLFLVQARKNTECFFVVQWKFSEEKMCCIVKISEIHRISLSGDKKLNQVMIQKVFRSFCFQGVHKKL